ncbi:MAG: SHOCT domain-containing protein [Paludibacter sp.]|nr:SHOCT domain-containing protein [Paludibacter sp.]
MMNGYEVFGWRMDLWWIVGIVMLIGIISLVTMRINRKNNNSRKPRKSALDILKERYVRGEINKHEFEERKRNLE